MQVRLSDNTSYLTPRIEQVCRFTIGGLCLDYQDIGGRFRGVLPTMETITCPPLYVESLLLTSLCLSYNKSPNSMFVRGF